MKNQNLTTFALTFLKVLSVFSVILASCLWVYTSFFYVPPYDPTLQKNSSLATEEDIKDFEDTISNKTTTPVRTNFLAVGVDQNELLTDFMMVGSFISTTGEINIMSVPRDTYISFEGDDLTNLRAINRGAPSYMKANSIYPYTYTDGIATLQGAIEDLLNIKIDYYVKIDLQALVDIVDEVGGIYFDVPSGGLKYSDPTQNLYINIPGGYQLLNGTQAEGLVRFRSGYANADLGRVEVQQEFIIEFITQIMNKETIMQNIGGLLLNFIKYVETDFSTSDLPKYLSSIPNIDINNINNATMPGYSGRIDDLSYYITDKEATKEIIDKFFYGNTSKLNSLTNDSDNSDDDKIVNETRE